jgi:phosphoribosylformylglycinamidine cyclo-ligase
MTSTTYRDSGVDIDAGDELVRRIKPLVRQTFTDGVVSDIGAFGGFFEVDFERYERPVLVSSMDGVGTKIKVAALAGRYEGVGQDLVNHCVNDIAVCGADPLFFLDYFATGKLDPDVGESIVSGFAKACAENHVALIGGETAEMPGLYAEGEYDLAGTIVGIVDRSRIVDGKATSEGDVIIGLPSTGLHTNGYSLARKVLLKEFALDDAPAVLGGPTVGEALLEVHRSYLHAIKALLSSDGLRGLAHVTGGGIPGNVARVIAEPLRAEVDYASWKRLPIFDLIQERGRVPEEDMRRTFNLGIGLIAVVAERFLDTCLEKLSSAGEYPVVVGNVVRG